PHTSYRFDPEYAPPLPRGAVRGDITRQVYCCDTPRYFYVDEPRTCVQCRRPFVFGAAEQKFWYETMRFNFASTAVRCVECRRQRRSDRALREQMAAAVAAVEAAPVEPAALLALAETTIAFVRRFGQGQLDRALAAVRQARQRRPEGGETYFFE